MKTKQEVRLNATEIKLVCDMMTLGVAHCGELMINAVAVFSPREARVTLDGIEQVVAIASTIVERMPEGPGPDLWWKASASLLGALRWHLADLAKREAVTDLTAVM